MKTKATDGEWYVTGRTNLVIKTKAKGDVLESPICSVETLLVPMDEARANASLIADSKKMLALIELSHHVLKTYVKGGNSEFKFEHDLVDDLSAILSKHSY